MKLLELDSNSFTVIVFVSDAVTEDLESTCMELAILGGPGDRHSAGFTTGLSLRGSDM